MTLCSNVLCKIIIIIKKSPVNTACSPQVGSHYQLTVPAEYRYVGLWNLSRQRHTAYSCKQQLVWGYPHKLAKLAIIGTAVV